MAVAPTRGMVEVLPSTSSRRSGHKPHIAEIVQQARAMLQAYLMSDPGFLDASAPRGSYIDLLI